MQLCENLAEINSLLEAEQPDLVLIQQKVPASIWDEWLWMTNAAAEMQGDCPVNRMHLLALVIARMRALCQHPPGGAQMTIAGTLKEPRACITSEVVSKLSLRMLNDTCSNLQMLWRELMESESLDTLYLAVDACFHRFGVLALRPRSAVELDDLELVDILKADVCTGAVCHGGGGARVTQGGHASEVGDSSAGHSEPLRVINMVCLRNLTAFFFSVYRHLHLASECFMLDPSEPCRTVFESHLVSASLDEFYAMSMYFDCTVAGIQQYRQNFQGMFHSISQVIYYQNPQYVRRKQISLEEIQTGKVPISTLPLFLQLHADAVMKREDDMLPRGFAVPGSAEPEDVSGVKLRSTHAAERDWIWFVVPGRVYLVARCGAVFYSENLSPLCNVVTDALGKTVVVRGEAAMSTV